MNTLSNQRTLDTYQAEFPTYMEKTPGVTTLDSSQGEWIRDVLIGVPPGASILEIGSATGRDAVFMTELGYSPKATDAFESAVTYLNENGIKAEQLNILTDDLDGTFDVIFAAAVFLHFTEEELRMVLKKLKHHLTDTGRIAFSLKQGSGEMWESEKLGAPRYFHFWRKDEVRQLAEDLDFKVSDERETPDKKWIHYIIESK